jgi:hypothetical protein
MSGQGAASRVSGLGLFLFFFALYALTSSGNAFRVPDEFEVYFQAEHLADAHDLSVPQTLSVNESGEPIFFGKFGLDGKPYAPYGPGVAFLILPFHLVGRALAGVAGVPRAALPQGIAWEFLVGGTTALAMALAGALAVAGFVRACRALGASGPDTRALAIVLGLCTILWPYATTLYCEAWLAAAFIWAAALLLEVVRPEASENASGFSRKIGAAAILIALAIVTKPTAIVIAPAFVIAVLLDRRGDRRARTTVASALSLAILAGASVHLLWNVTRFGNPLDFGYNLAGMIPHPPARPFLPEEIPRGLFVQLLTPGKSLFIWAPVTLLSLFSLRSCWRRERGLAAGLIAGTASALIFYAAYFFPDGGYSHGPRHLVPLVPLMMLPLAIPGVAIARSALRACAAVGFIMAALAVTVSFFEDQAPVQIGTRLISPYYERVDPRPGGPNLRYRTDYIPFKFALTSGRWLSRSRAPGNGPDFFALHLVQARRMFPGGGAIPSWLPWAVSLPWIVIAALAARRARVSGTTTTRITKTLMHS